MDTIIRLIRILITYVNILISCPSVRLPAIIIFAPIHEISKIHEYIENCMTGEFSASSFSALYEKIQTFSFSNIDKFSTAGLVTRMTTDVMNVQQAFQMSIRICVRAPIMLVSAMVMTFMIHPRFAHIFLVVSKIHEYIENCMTGEFSASSFSAFTNRLRIFSLSVSNRPIS